MSGAFILIGGFVLFILILLVGVLITEGLKPWRHEEIEMAKRLHPRKKADAVPEDKD